MFTNQIIWPANSRLQHTAKHSPVGSFDQQTAGYSIQPNIHQSDHLTSKQQATAYSQTFTSRIIWPANSRLQHTAKHSPVRSFDQQTAGYSIQPNIHQSDHLTSKQQATAQSQRLMLIVHQSDHLTSSQQATAYSQRLTFTSVGFSFIFILKHRFILSQLAQITNIHIYICTSLMHICTHTCTTIHL